MPDWLEERIRREVAAWDTPPPRLRAARYKRLDAAAAAPRARRLVVALAVAVAAVGVGSAQVGAVPARVVQFASQLTESSAPATVPTPPPTPDADDSPSVAPPYAPPAPNRPISIVGSTKEPGQEGGHRPQASPSPRSDDRDRFEGQTPSSSPSPLPTASGDSSEGR